MITFSGKAVLFSPNDKIAISGKFRMFPNTHGFPTVEPLYNSYIKEELCSVECILRYGDLYYFMTDKGATWRKKDPSQPFLSF